MVPRPRGTISDAAWSVRAERRTLLPVGLWGSIPFTGRQRAPRTCLPQVCEGGRSRYTQGPQRARRSQFRIHGKHSTPGALFAAGPGATAGRESARERTDDAAYVRGGLSLRKGPGRSRANRRERSTYSFVMSVTDKIDLEVKAMVKQIATLATIGMLAVGVGGCTTTEGTLVGAGVGAATGAVATGDVGGAVAGGAIGAGAGYLLCKNGHC